VEAIMQLIAHLRKLGVPLALIPRPSIIILIMIWGTTFPDIPWKESFIIAGLAFGQNAAYSLQSRAGNRTSNLYHFIAAVFATTVFFVSLSYLVYLKVTLAVLLIYIFGTMLGSVYGTRLSLRIEHLIGAVADLGTETKGQALPLRTAVFWLSLILVGEFALLHYNIVPSRFSQDGDGVMLAVTIAAAAYVSNVLFASLRVVRSTNAYWSHLGLVLLQSAATIAIYDVLVKAGGNWYLFGPYLTGSIIGSLLGADWGKYLSAHIGASWHARKVGTQELLYPWKQFLVCSLLLVPHTAYFVVTELADTLWLPQMLVLGATVLQASAFTVVSRARQRNHELYIEWSSVFSNGIWFMTLNLLVVNEMASYLIIPYVVGMGIGSLWGQNIAIHLESEIGATMDGVLKK
jgi:hypothetical protein